MATMVPGAPVPRAGTTRNEAKKARFASIAAARQLPRVRVLPASEELRRVLKHPNGMRFRSEGSVEWPRDKYTERRLADGSITIEQQPAEPRPAAPYRLPPTVEP